MKEIRINQELEHYDISTKKARVISIKGGKILICIYAGIYMLPGGKLDKEEEAIAALKRELLEETGNNINDDEVIPYIRIINSQKDYLSRDRTSSSSKRIDTTYFIVNHPLEVRTQRLSEKEKESSFELKYIDIRELLSVLEQINDPKGKIFAQELLYVLKEYLKDHPYIDLHTHTCYSDGEYTPDEVIEMAKKNNISDIAITDHDTILGLNNIDYDKHTGINIIPGIEISVKVKKGRMHVLGLDIDYNSPQLLEFLKTMRENNFSNLHNIIDYLKSIGISFDQSDIDEIFTHTGNVGRPDVAKLLIKDGYAKDVDDAFKKYLIEAFDMVKDKYRGYTYKDVLNVISEANGVSILAHPNSLLLNKSDFEILLKDMINYGLQGLEVCHPNMNDQEREFYMDMVEKYHLLYSAGSDFHGEEVKPDIRLGEGRNNLYIHDASVLKYIKNRESK